MRAHAVYLSFMAILAATAFVLSFYTEFELVQISKYVENVGRYVYVMKEVGEMFTLF